MGEYTYLIPDELIEKIKFIIRKSPKRSDVGVMFLPEIFNNKETLISLFDIRKNKIGTGYFFRFEYKFLSVEGKCIRGPETTNVVKWDIKKMTSKIYFSFTGDF